MKVVSAALGPDAVMVAVVIATTGWLRRSRRLAAGRAADPARALLLLPEAASVLLESTPRGLDLADVRRYLLEIPHVHDVHDVHASQIFTGLPVLSAQVVVDDSCFHDGHLPTMLDAVQRCVADHFPVSIERSTFQFEPLSHVEYGHATHA